MSKNPWELSWADAEADSSAPWEQDWNEVEPEVPAASSQIGGRVRPPEPQYQTQPMGSPGILPDAEFYSDVAAGMGELFVDPVQRGFNRFQQSMGYLANSPEEIAAQQVDLNELGESERVQALQERTQGLGFLASALEFGKDPLAVLELTLESAAQSIPSLAGGAVLGGGGGMAAGPPGALAGVMAGAGTGSFATEYTNMMMGQMRAAGYDLNDPDSIREAFANEEFMSGARDLAVDKGWPVAAFDALSAGIAGRIFGPTARAVSRGEDLTPTGKIAGGVAEVGAQGAAGGAGEVAGSLNIGQEPEPFDVLAEVFGEVVPGAAEIAVAETARRIGDQRIEDALPEGQIPLEGDGTISDNADQQQEIPTGSAPLAGEDTPSPSPVAPSEPAVPPQGQSVSFPTKVTTARGNEVGVDWQVVEGDVSGPLTTSDESAYNQALQPRDRGDRATSEAQIAEIAANLDPERLAISSEADRGAPIVGPDGMVESGNGRVAAIRRAYSGTGEKGEEYRRYIEGVTGVDTSEMIAPILIRRRTTDMTPEERQQFAVEANESATMQLSDTERAQADVASVSEIIGLLQPGDLTSAANSEFRQAFIGGLNPADQNSMTGADGNISQAGLRRMEAAILASAYGGTPESNATLNRMLESTDDNTRSITGALSDVAPRFGQLRQSIFDGQVDGQWDISRPIVTAVETVSQLRDSGTSVREWLDQGDIFGDRDVVVEELIRSFYNPELTRALGRDRIASALTYYAEEAAATGQGVDMFGGAEQTPEGVIREGRERAAPSEAQNQQGGLFAASGAPAQPAEGGQQAQRPGDDEAGSGTEAPAEGELSGGGAQQPAAPAEPEPGAGGTAEGRAETQAQEGPVDASDQTVGAMMKDMEAEALADLETTKTFPFAGHSLRMRHGAQVELEIQQNEEGRTRRVWSLDGEKVSRKKLADALKGLVPQGEIQADRQAAADQFILRVADAPDDIQQIMTRLATDFPQEIGELVLAEDGTGTWPGYYKLQAAIEGGGWTEAEIAEAAEDVGIFNDGAGWNRNAAPVDAEALAEVAGEYIQGDYPNKGQEVTADEVRGRGPEGTEGQPAEGQEQGEAAPDEENQKGAEGEQDPLALVENPEAHRQARENLEEAEKAAEEALRGTHIMERLDPILWNFSYSLDELERGRTEVAIDQSDASYMFEYYGDADGFYEKMNLFLQEIPKYIAREKGRGEDETYWGTFGPRDDSSGKWNFSDKSKGDTYQSVGDDVDIPQEYKMSTDWENELFSNDATPHSLHLKKNAPPVVTYDEATEIIGNWKKYATEQSGKTGFDGKTNADKTVIFLFEESGVARQPWIDAGYTVYAWDAKEGVDISDIDVDVLYGSIENEDHVWAVFAYPPCTVLSSSSNARSFPAADADGRTEAAKALVYDTLGIIEKTRPAYWYIENPRGSRIGQAMEPTRRNPDQEKWSVTGLGKPTLNYSHYHFGDDFNKPTSLWGPFNRELPTANLGGSDKGTANTPGSKTRKTKQARSKFPEGFSNAFFMANNYMDNPVDALHWYFPFSTGAVDQALEAGMTPEEIWAEVGELSDRWDEGSGDAVAEALYDAVVERQSGEDVTADHPLNTDEREAYIDSAVQRIATITEGNEEAIRQAVSEGASNADILKAARIGAGYNSSTIERGSVENRGRNVTINPGSTLGLEVKLTPKEVADRLRRIYSSGEPAAERQFTTERDFVNGLVASMFDNASAEYQQEVRERLAESNPAKSSGNAIVRNLLRYKKKDWVGEFDGAEFRRTDSNDIQFRRDDLNNGEWKTVKSGNVKLRLAKYLEGQAEAGAAASVSGTGLGDSLQVEEIGPDNWAFGTTDPDGVFEAIEEGFDSEQEAIEAGEAFRARQVKGMAGSFRGGSKMKDKVKNTRVPRGGLAPEFEEVSFTNRRSIYNQAFIDAGFDPGVAANMPIGRQIRILQKLFKDKFDVTVQVAEDSLKRESVDAMLDGYRNMQMMLHSIGLPLASLSHDGQLKLVLERFKGQYLGAYSPGEKAIYMPGRSNSFAHEWMHSLDHFMSDVLTGPQWEMLSRQVRRDGLDNDPESTEEAFVKVMNALFFDKEMLEAAADLLHHQIHGNAKEQEVLAGYDPAEKDTKAAREAKRQLEEIRKGSSKLVNAKNAYYRAAQSFQPGSDYWTDPAEMLARAFEAYIGTKMKDLGTTTEFISKGEWAYLNDGDRRMKLTFPKAGDRDAIFAAFDDLFSQLGADYAIGRHKPAERPSDEGIYDPAQWDAYVDPNKDDRPVAVRMREGMQEWMREAKTHFRSASGRKDNERNFGGVTSAYRGLQSFAFSIRGMMQSIQKKYNSRAVQQIIDMVATDPGSGRLVGSTFEEEVEQHFKRQVNRVTNIVNRYDLKRMTDEERKMLRDVMVSITPSEKVPKNISDAAAALRGLMDDEWYRNRAAGIRLGYTKNGYLQRMLDYDLVWNNPEKFARQAAKVYKVQFDQQVGTDPHSPKFDMDAFMKAAGNIRHPDRKEAIEPFIKSIKKLQKQLGDENLDEADIEQIQQEIANNVEAILDDVRDAYGEESALAWRENIMVGSPTDYDTKGPDSNYTLSRALPPAADKLLEDFLNTDPIDSIAQYMLRSSRRVEFTKKFGAGGEKLESLLSQAEKQGVHPVDIRHLRSLVETITGRSTNEEYAVQGILNAVHTLGTLALLPRAVYSSLAEPITAFGRTKDTRDLVDPFIRMVESVLKTDNAKAREEVAQAIGAIVNARYDTLVQSRVSGDVPLGRRNERILGNFFQRNLLTPLTNSQRKSMVGTGHRFLSRMLETALDAEATPEARKIAQMELAELGISPSQISDFSDWINQAGGALPRARDIHGSEAGVLYSRAMNRLIDQIIQNPKKVDRPQLANAPVLRMMYGIMSFQYAFWRNVNVAYAKRMKRNADVKGSLQGYGEGIGHAAAFMSALWFGQFMVTVAREALFNSDKWDEKDKEDELLKWLIELSFYRTGLTGVFDPGLQLIRGVRYEKDFTAALAGAQLGFYAQNLQTIAKMYFGRNSENTNTSEYRAAQSLYRITAQPALMYALSLTPGSMLSNLALAPIMHYTSSQSANEAVAEWATGGPPGTKTEPNRGDRPARSRPEREAREREGR